MKNKQKVKILIRDSYLAAIKNSAAAKMFRNMYALVGNKKQDILQDGGLSCAYFVSAILLMFGLMKKVHATVFGTIEDMKNCGWKKVKTPKEGSVLVWEKKKFGKEEHSHIGFYIGDKKAVSNLAEKRAPVKHNFTFSGKRKIEQIWWHKRLEG